MISAIDIWANIAIKVWKKYNKTTLKDLLWFYGQNVSFIHMWMNTFDVSSTHNYCSQSIYNTEPYQWDMVDYWYCELETHFKDQILMLTWI